MKYLFMLLLAGICFHVQAQKDSLAPAYKRYPTVPALQLILSDSVTKYTKNDIPKKKPVLLILFNPECSHCQHEAEQIVANKEAFQHIHIVMATTAPLHQMKTFADQYGLSQLQNVVVAKDPYYILPSFFEIRSLPYLAFYNKKGNLISTFEGSMGIERILTTFKNN